MSPKMLRKIALYLEYIAFVIRREADAAEKKKAVKCGYCQSEEPCFDGKSMAGFPCQHPEMPPQ